MVIGSAMVQRPLPDGNAHLNLLSPVRFVKRRAGASGDGGGLAAIGVIHAATSCGHLQKHSTAID
jgi:hypothetical protein